MTSVRAFLRQRSAMPGGLADVVSDVNRSFTNDVGDSGRFMTLFYCRIDMAARRYSWVRAGHDPALLYDPIQEKFTELTSSGLPLGVQADCRYGEGRHPIIPGQILAIGTDGLWETSNSDMQTFGKSRFKKVLKQLIHLDAGDIADGIIEAVREFGNPMRFEDDVTLVVVKIPE